MRLTAIARYRSDVRCFIDDDGDNLVGCLLVPVRVLFHLQ